MRSRDIIVDESDDGDQLIRIDGEISLIASVPSDAREDALDDVDELSRELEHLLRLHRE